jgi:hypothetical protein
LRKNIFHFTWAAAALQFQPFGESLTAKSTHNAKYSRIGKKKKRWGIKEEMERFDRSLCAHSNG